MLDSSRLWASPSGPKSCECGEHFLAVNGSPRRSGRCVYRPYHYNDDTVCVFSNLQPEWSSGARWSWSSGETLEATAA